MINKISKIFVTKNKGFSLLELLISMAILSIIIPAIVLFFLSMNASNLKTTADREVIENATRALDVMTYEIRSAMSIYTPTTTASQLSLETSRYSTAGEGSTYIDFFMCGSAVCMKKENQDAIALTSDSVKVTGLTFLQVLTGSISSVQVNLIINSGSGSTASLLNLVSTASLRNY